jgi:hypothetical protein
MRTRACMRMGGWDMGVASVESVHVCMKACIFTCIHASIRLHICPSVCVLISLSVNLY